jgi:predicted MPP superfamily phosphohydrolase
VIAVFILLGLVAVGLVVTAHWYLWRRLVRDTMTRGGWPRRLATAAIVLLPLTSFAATASTRAGAPFAVQRAVAWPGYFWLALLLYLLLATLAGELVRPVLHRLMRRRATPEAESAGDTETREAAVAALAQQVAGKPAGTAGQTEAGDGAPDTEDPPQATVDANASRRLFVARSVALVATTAAAGTVGYGAYGVLGKAPRVKRVTIPLAKLPRAAHGYRIAVVSDIHLGPILGRAHTQRIVETINRTNPDLITIVGDLVDGSVHDLAPATEPLRDLRARDGAYFVTGNHEYFSGAGPWVDHVRELGVHPLENARTELAAFDLAGVNDISGESHDDGPDYGKALGDRDTSRASVLLAHQPVMIHDAVKHHVDLQLSGHTHGGQLWPGNLVARAANPTVAGLERYGDTQLYVTRGAGAWGPPVRVGAPSDITVVELASLKA